MMLDSVDQRRTWLTRELQLPSGCGINLIIWTANVDALHRHVLDAGIPIFLEMAERWHRYGDASRQFLIQDPDGYLPRIAQGLGEQAASA